MIVGHYGLAAAVKAREPATPLWTLMLATVWLDVLFVPLLAVGVESLERVPGAGVYGGVVIHADYTHSLVGAAILSAALALAGAWAWGRRSGLVIGLVSCSHWLLDLLVHRADLPLLPGNAGDLPKFGFGLWRVVAASAMVELILLLAGAFFYWRTAEKITRAVDGNSSLATRSSLILFAIGTLVLAIDVAGLLG